MGSGTTGVVAKRLHRQWIGFEKESEYVSIAQTRIDAVSPIDLDEAVFDVRGKRRKAQRVPFSALLEYGLLQPGQQLFYRQQSDKAAVIKPDGRLVSGDQEGTIHQLGRVMSNGRPCNGWDHWYYQTESGEMSPIESLRQELRSRFQQTED